MEKNPRNYPDTMAGPETGRSMTRGEKRVSFKIDGKTFTYLQPGWWCSLDDPDDMEGQLVDEDNRIAEMPRTLKDVIASLPLDQQQEIEARAARYLREEMAKSNPRSAHDFSTLDAFLDEHGVREAFQAVAIKEGELIEVKHDDQGTEEIS